MINMSKHSRDCCCCCPRNSCCPCEPCCCNNNSCCNGGGFGGGFGSGFGRGLAINQYATKTHKDFLQEQKELLQSRIEVIDKQLKYL